MNKDKIQELAEVFAKTQKREEALFGNKGAVTDFVRQTLQAALDGEMEHHLGYRKHKSRIGSNTRNGRSRKTLKMEHGHAKLEVPGDRAASFEPGIVKKRQTRFQGLDTKIMAMYARGLRTQGIQCQLQELYDIDVASSLISSVTARVLEEVRSGQNRAVYLDCLEVKVREDKQVIKKSVYLTLGIDSEGKKELLGMWIAKTEGAKIWLWVQKELKNRGLKEILIACVGGLTGLPAAINTVYPETQVQRCIVYLVRHSLRYVSYKDRKSGSW